MTARLTSQLLVSALIRRAESTGGTAMVLQKGEALSGAILVQILERGQNIGLFERVTDLDGRVRLIPAGPGKSLDSNELNQYLARRRRADPDIWFVELDVAQGEQLAADILCAG